MPEPSTAGGVDRWAGAAAQAWWETGGGPVDAVRRLSPRSSIPGERKAYVFLLQGSAPESRAVIAKFSPLETGRVERRVYQEILPSLPVASPRLLGTLEAPAERRVWLFLEFVGDEDKGADERALRLHGARWLARVHASARHHPALAGLPERGEAHYLRHLRDARARLESARADSRRHEGDRGVIEEVLRRLDRLEDGWPRIAAADHEAPVTLAHSDFVRKNVRAGRDGAGEVPMVVFDWETAGRGAPGPDLVGARCDPDAYHREIREAWPEMSRGLLARLVRLGKLFRLIAAVDWSSESLAWVEKRNPILCLELYTERLDTLEGAPW